MLRVEAVEQGLRVRKEFKACKEAQESGRKEHKARKVCRDRQEMMAVPKVCKGLKVFKACKESKASRVLP